MRRRHFCTAAIAGLAFAQPSSASGVLARMPQAQRAGSTRLTFWGFEIYDATLWVAPGFLADTRATAAFALELVYLRNFEGKAIAERSLAEMRRQEAVADATAQAWLARMQAAFPNIAKGDTLIGFHHGAGRVSFTHNGRTTTEFSDAAFAQRFFDIWLGPKSSEPAMRDKLLAPLQAKAAGKAASAVRAPELPS